MCTQHRRIDVPDRHGGPRKQAERDREWCVAVRRCCEQVQNVPVSAEHRRIGADRPTSRLLHCERHGGLIGAESRGTHVKPDVGIRLEGRRETLHEPGEKLVHTQLWVQPAPDPSQRLEELFVLQLRDCRLFPDEVAGS